MALRLAARVHLHEAFGPALPVVRPLPVLLLLAARERHPRDDAVAADEVRVAARELGERLLEQQDVHLVALVLRVQRLAAAAVARDAVVDHDVDLLAQRAVVQPHDVPV